MQPWLWESCQVWFIPRKKVHRVDSEMYGLIEQSWLQLICCTICLLYSHNFRWEKEVWDRSEYWLICHYWTLEIEFNKNYLCQLSDILISDANNVPFELFTYIGNAWSFSSIAPITLSEGFSGEILTGVRTLP